MTGQSERRQYFHVGGASYPNGFHLDFTTANGMWGRLPFAEPGTDEMASRRTDWLTLCIFGAMYIAAFASPWLWPKVFVVVLLFTSLNSLTEASFKRWHWVEHQAALWLEGVHPELERVNPVSHRCGSVMVTSRALFVSSLVMVAWDYGVIATPVVLSTFSLLLAYDAFDTREQNFLRVCAWPATMVCLALQRLLFLRKPTDRHTQYAKEWAATTAHRIADALISTPRPVVLKIRSGGSI